MNIHFDKRKPRLFIGDAAIVLLLAALCVLAFFMLRKDGNATANVYYDGKLCKTLALNSDTVFSPDGGHTVVKVEDGRAYIESSDCPDGVCISMHGVDETGGSAVCVPNRVSVTSGRDTAHDGIDAVAG